MREVPRRILVTAIQLPDSADVLMLIAGTSQNRWKTAQDKLRNIGKTFQASKSKCRQEERDARRELLTAQ